MKQIIFYMVFVLALAGCQRISDDKLSYTVGGCNEDNWIRAKGEPQFQVDIGDSISIKQKQPYVCCAEIKVHYEVEDSTVNIYEDNEGEICKCMCSYDIDIQINEPDIDRVKVYGIKYEGYEYELLYDSKNLDMAAECSNADDCVRGGCSGTVCQAKTAEPTFTTCEYEPQFECYTMIECGCVQGQCQWQKTEEFNSCVKEKSSEPTPTVG